MPASTVRADYDQLKQAASAFGQNSTNCQQTLQRLKSNMDTLQGGDWIGQGANAFYKEMGDSVLPTLQRLINALNTAQNSLTKISAVIKDAEDQAANVLKGPGRSSGPIGTSFGAATGAGLGAAIGGVAGAGSTGPIGAASPARPEMVGVKTSANYEWIKASGAAAPGSPNIASNTIGGQKNDAGSKDPAFEQGVKGSQVGGLANEGWERDNAQFNQTAGKIADGASNTIGGAASSDWIKASGAAGPHIPSNTVGGQYEWIKASGAASPKIDTNTLGGKTSQTWTDGGKTAHDDWSQTGGANTIGGGTFKDGWQNTGGGSGAPGAPGAGGTAGHVFKDGWQNTGAGNTIGGAAADDWQNTGAGNTIGGAAADDWQNTGGPAAPSGDNPGSIVGEETPNVDHTGNLSGGAASDG